MPLPDPTARTAAPTTPPTARPTTLSFARRAAPPPNWQPAPLSSIRSSNRAVCPRARTSTPLARRPRAATARAGLPSFCAAAPPARRGAPNPQAPGARMHSDRACAASTRPPPLPDPPLAPRPQAVPRGGRPAPHQRPGLRAPNTTITLSPPPPPAGPRSPRHCCTAQVAPNTCRQRAPAPLAAPLGCALLPTHKSVLGARARGRPSGKRARTRASIFATRSSVPLAAAAAARAAPRRRARAPPRRGISVDGFSPPTGVSEVLSVSATLLVASHNATP
jgi:hypothetical protein